MVLSGDAAGLTDALRFAEQRDAVRAAHFALVSLGEKAVPSLVGFLSDDLTERGQRAWWTLMSIGQPAQASLVDRLRSNSTPAARAAAAWVLGAVGDHTVDRHLVRALDDEDDLVKLPAALALGFRACREAVPSLLRMLAGRYDDGSAPHPDQLAFALPGFDLYGEVRDETGEEREGLVSRSPSSVLEERVTSCSRSVGDDLEICLDVLGDAFGDAVFAVCRSSDDLIPSWVASPWCHWQERHLREAAALSLARIGDPRAVKWLVRCVEDDGEPVLLRRMAIMALGCIGDEKGFDAVYDALRDDDLVDEALWSLGAFADRRALKPLVRAAFTSDSSRIAAVDGLSSYADPATLPYLIKLVSDRDEAVVRRALEGLARLGSQTALEAVVSQLTNGDPVIRREAAMALMSAQEHRASL